MAAQIEAVTLELDRLGEPADDAVRLEDRAPNAALAQYVGGGQSGRPRAEDDGSGRRRSGVLQPLTQVSNSTRRPGGLPPGALGPQLMYARRTSPKSPS